MYGRMYIVCPQPTVAQPGYGYQGYQQPAYGGVDPLTGAFINAAGQAAGAAVMCGINPRCGQPIVRPRR
ncbi:MAG: hypothetical protein Q8P97_00105 [bacterium]|nr:hypothetical protein [bacterium]